MSSIREQLRERLTRPGGLATRLRDARTSAHLTGKQLADQAGWAASKVTRTEQGTQLPSGQDLDTWAALCGVDADQNAHNHALLSEAQDARAAWKLRLAAGQPAVQRDYNKLVADTSRVCHFETVWVPGLLQTPEYARQTFAGISALHGTSADEVDAAVAARMERQRHLYDTSKMFEFLLAEPVLRWLLCPPDVMRGQLDRLQTIVGLPNVRFGVLPMGVQLKMAPQNSFQMYDDLAIVETFTAEDQRQGDEAEKYAEILAALWSEAAVDEDARRLIVAAVDALG